MRVFSPILVLGLLLAVVPCLCGGPAQGATSAAMACHMDSEQETDTSCCCSDEGTHVQAASQDLSLGILTDHTPFAGPAFHLTLLSSFCALPDVSRRAPLPRFSIPSESPPLFLLNASFLI